MKYGILTQRTVTLTDQNIDDIMVSALEGGITYWCSKCEVSGKYLGQYASEQISRGGTLVLTDSVEEKKERLNLDLFLKGFGKFIEQGYDIYNALQPDGTVDTGNIDGERADIIVQLALFGDVIYG